MIDKSKFDVVPFMKDQVFNFTSIVREFVSLGFTWNTDITDTEKEQGIKGYFIKPLHVSIGGNAQ